jgi:hypothetical protein
VPTALADANRRPKPTVQPLGPGPLSAILVAVTAPVASAVPLALTHSPIFRAAAVLATTVVTVVAGVVVTVTVVVCDARGDVTVIVEPEILSTRPEAPTAANRRPPPVGAPLGRLALVGRVRPNPPRVQELLLAGVIVIAFAVSEVSGAVAAEGEAEPGVDEVAVTAVMQSPTVMALSGTFSDVVNLVPAV